MADGQQEAVAPLPVRVLRPVAQRVEVGHGQHVGDAERLGDVALALHLAHAQRVAADAVGAFGQARHVGQASCVRPLVHGLSPGSADAATAQWISMPPLTSITAPVT